MITDFEESLIKTAVATLTERQIEVLRKMQAGIELVMESGTAYIGHDRTSARTVFALLRVCAISPEVGSGKFERYTLNGTGREILKRLAREGK